ncbi:MAG: bifunctional diaminohydroxyphosphoribosylaminopyrimidine deaminase/5-amino-6-(5-phosphoribosylamino)uracil reductase RibD [Armatimonadota bacterium]|nr:bifunctional diaminohydroxyphosphoribosylaminopyrimidine deaminase/5-amino-6-(5-phosphoribosylamino)uracil reductase RibD [Armatimonadota bacterium]MDR7438546.1 bifunctional diaminohydroxyphosphoribosylaminopyrimidine deaminase/5-amino-6-(5-phosphoribosylamino)uracil reductase RibD [Armatimonadota bacterium]MDR7562354.1 bifunctional diaminohydroxyphosphoribosylaminopyrimidine deaminase/5-amino-6-(5-phosphoribosylamino)uracil reductase RibD [Armatimonadota bacterium]MDR7568229.1 bifunctional d
MVDDAYWMRRVLEMARSGQGRTSPNPLVGAVVVRQGQEVGCGYHAAAGAPHAEVVALRAAGPLARGATLYVNLEPCDHHGRTPPCTQAILAAGISRVVVAHEDPDPRVRGRGIARLRAAGLEVEVGVLEEEARRLNAPYLKHRTTGLPLVTVKWAMSLDGRIATRTGSSRWITGPQAREEAHRLRDVHDAVLVGIGTVLRDDPALTCRIPGGRDPLRVVADSHLRTPSDARMLREGSSPVVVAATPRARPEEAERLRRCGAEVWVCAAEDGRVSLRDLLRRLGERGVLSVLVEGGSTLHAAVLEAGLADRIVAFIAPVLMGGREAPGPVGGAGIAEITQALRLRNLTVRPVGTDLCVEAEVSGALPVRGEVAGAGRVR